MRVKRRYGSHMSRRGMSLAGAEYVFSAAASTLSTFGKSPPPGAWNAAFRSPNSAFLLARIFLTVFLSC